MAATDFRWPPNGPPPKLRDHSRAKLDVLRRYLRAYFDKLNVRPNADACKLDLVDGFAGGGTFRDGNATVSGTPLIMLEEAQRAHDRLNERRKKPLHFDCRFHFVDINQDHTDHLRMVLSDRGYQVKVGGPITIHTSPFQSVAETIIGKVLAHQPRAGRSIFVLDQSGYTHAGLALLARILSDLPKVEVILTIATDSLINHIPETLSLIKPIAALGLTESKLHDLARLRNGAGGRALIEHMLRAHMREYTKAPFDTPFFLRPIDSRRSLWFLHLSKHPTARDVMVQEHWHLANTFEHHGRGDFGIIGFDALRDLETLSLFRFGDVEASQMHEQLLVSLLQEIFALTARGPVSVQELRRVVANRTAARFSDIDKVLLQLAREKEIDLRGDDGREVGLIGRKHLPRDVLILRPAKLIFPVMSRLNRAR